MRKESTEQTEITEQTEKREEDKFSAFSFRLFRYFRLFRTLSSFILKHVLQRDLDVAAAAGAENAPEVRIAAVRFRVAEHLVVQRVEQLEAEVDALPLGDGKSLVERGVVGEAGGPAEGVESDRAEPLLRDRRV